jgi:hypothetical protein
MMCVVRIYLILIWTGVDALLLVSLACDRVLSFEACNYSLADSVNGPITFSFIYLQY